MSSNAAKSMNAESGASKKNLTGMERAALLMLSLGHDHGQAIWEDFTEDEIKDISLAMAKLGAVDNSLIEDMFVSFISRMSSSGAMMGSYESTEKLLEQFLPKDRVSTIMEELRGPAGRNMWEKLSNIQEETLANYLKNEYPQTTAVILSKISADHAARVLAILPEEFAMDVMARMLRMESVQKEILERVEQTLRIEFMANLAQTSKRDPHELMADIFNGFDRQTESRFMGALEERSRESAEKIKSLMFTFEDLGKLDPGSMQTILRTVEKDKLALALKNASDTMRTFFFNNMSSRASQNLKDDMASLGPTRLKDIDDAQAHVVNVTKDLAARGEVVINKNSNEDELVY